MSRTRRFELAATLVALVWLPAGLRAQSDPLARPELDTEISLKLPGVDVVRLFDTVAKLTKVPFVLEFDPDPALKTDITMEHAPARTVLVSLASTLGLEYSARAEGIGVRRKGVSPSGKGLVLGRWPGKQVRVEMQVRAADGRVLSTPKVTTQLGQALEMKQGVERTSGKPYLVVRLTPSQETGDTLTLEMKVVDTRTISATRWIEDHRKETLIVGKGETLLFKTDDGIETYLRTWERIEK
jgi:hypothetical protein